MIVSHSHQFIFIAIPKTGTHAIRFALREYLGEKDEEQVKLFSQSDLNNKALAQLRHGHITAMQAKTQLPSWKQYYKFGFVRNPYDRLVSFAHYFYGNHPVMQKAPNLHLKKLLLFPPEERMTWFRPQVDFLCNDEGTLLVDFVGKVESLQQDFNEVCRHIKLPLSNLKKINSSKHTIYSAYYDEELAELAYTYYQKDFKVFNYSQDSWKTN